MVALTRTPEQTQAQTLYKLTHAFDMALHKLIPLHADSDELPPFLLADEEQIEAYQQARRALKQAFNESPPQIFLAGCDMLHSSLKLTYQLVRRLFGSRKEYQQVYDVYKTDYENVRAELFRISNPDLCREGS